MPSEPHTRRRDGIERFGFCTFAMHAANRDAVRVLATRIGDNERWVFTDAGKPRPSEQPEAYKARRIRERLTRRMIADHCAALGLHPFEVLRTVALVPAVIAAVAARRAGTPLAATA